MTADESTARADQTGPAAGAGAAHARAAAIAPDPTEAAPRRSLVEKAKALLEWWKHTRPARANARFGARSGGVLTGGIAYAALFSVFAALTIGYTIFMAVLGNNDELRQKVLNALDDYLPGLLDMHGTGNGIDPESLQLNGGLTVAGIV